MAEQFKVGMAELKTAKAPDTLLTSGLGSCIGVCLWDRFAKIGGIAHVMLPSSHQGKQKDNKAKYADTAIPLLVEEMTRMGAEPSRLVAKIAGGAQMFSFYSENDIMKIGLRNAEAVKEALKKIHLRISAEETGGNFGRTIELFPENGQLSVRTINHGEKIV